MKKTTKAILFALWFLGGVVALYAVMMGCVVLLGVGFVMNMAALWYPWIKALEMGHVPRAYERFALYASLVLVAAFGAGFLILHPPALRVTAPPQPTPCPTVCPTP